MKFEFLTKDLLEKNNRQFKDRIFNESSMMFYDHRIDKKLNLISFGIGELGMTYPPFIFLFKEPNCQYHHVEDIDHLVITLRNFLFDLGDRKANVILFLNLADKDHDDIELIIRKQLPWNFEVNIVIVKTSNPFQTPRIIENLHQESEFATIS